MSEKQDDFQYKQQCFLNALKAPRSIKEDASFYIGKLSDFLTEQQLFDKILNIACTPNVFNILFLNKTRLFVEYDAVHKRILLNFDTIKDNLRTNNMNMFLLFCTEIFNREVE